MNENSWDQYKDNLILIRNYQNWIEDLHLKQKNGTKKEKDNLRLQVLLYLSSQRARKELKTIKKKLKRLNRRQPLPQREVNYIEKIFDNCVRSFKNLYTGITTPTN